MARVLYLTHVFPYPLNSGAKVRAYHMLRHLSSQHTVTLVSFVRRDDTSAAVEHLRGICGTVYTVPVRRSSWLNLRAGAKGMLTGQPMTVVRDEMPEMAALIRRIAGDGAFDVVHADQLSMAGYGRLAARAGGSTVRSLLDDHNAIYLLTQRMAATEANTIRRLIMRREASAFSRYEAAMCRAYDMVLTVTQEDRHHLLALFPAAEREHLAGKLIPVPISVDPGQVAPVVHESDGQPTILHVGTMFWPPNVGGVLWFAREVLPRIRQQAPGVRFVVVGKDPPAEVRALAADPAIEVTGYVSDLKPYLAKADAMVVPLHAGGGMRVKILDGWLWGLPMVSTPIGAEGVDLADGQNILLAAGEEAFAAATLRLLTCPDLNQTLRTSGRAWVEAHYSWQAVYQQMDQVYHRLLA